MRDDEAISSRQAARLWSVPESVVRRVLRAHLAVADQALIQVKGTWIAPLGWWRRTLNGVLVNRIVAEIGRRHYSLPSGGEQWMRAHPKAAGQLHEDVMALSANESIEFEFAITGRVWAGDPRGVKEQLCDEMYDMDDKLARVKWTGKWRIDVERMSRALVRSIASLTVAQVSRVSSIEFAWPGW